jgi:hypothetical protein
MKLAWETEKKRNAEQHSNNESVQSLTDQLNRTQRALRAVQQRATRLEQEKKAYKTSTITIESASPTSCAVLQDEIEQLTIEKVRVSILLFNI